MSCVGDLLFTVGTCCGVTVMADTSNRKLRICKYRSAILPQLRHWTSLGDCCAPDPLICPPLEQNPAGSHDYDTGSPLNTLAAEPVILLAYAAQK